jgi:hypothetical protein
MWARCDGSPSSGGLLSSARTSIHRGGPFIAEGARPCTSEARQEGCTVLGQDHAILAGTASALCRSTPEINSSLTVPEQSASLRTAASVVRADKSSHRHLPRALPPQVSTDLSELPVA